MSDNTSQSIGLWAAAITGIGTLTTIVVKWWLARADRSDAELSSYRDELRADIIALRVELATQDGQIVQLVQDKGECLRKVGVLEYQVADLAKRLARYETTQPEGAS